MKFTNTTTTTTFVAVIVTAALAQPVAAGIKADCFKTWDCTRDVDGYENRGLLQNSDGMCVLPDYHANGNVYPFIPGERHISWYAGPTEGGVVKEWQCHTRVHHDSAAEARQYCFDIGAKSTCIWDECDNPTYPDACKVTTKTWGDPHFRSMAGEDFDFHGVCDLVFFSAPEENVAIHVRTEEMFDYSYISSAAIRINEDTLEVGSWGEFIFNGVEGSDLPETIGGHSLAMEVPNRKNTLFTIDLGNGEKVILKAFKNMVAVSLQLSHHGKFSNSIGIMGNLETGQRLGRDGTSVYTGNSDEYGFQWQVRDDEPKLFETARAPQFPATCTMPKMLSKEEKKRRLGEKSISREDAEEACATWGLNKEQCIYDVIATNDLEAAEAGVF